eukprot:177557-Chlamydomonas_euryale.AAC.15
MSAIELCSAHDHSTQTACEKVCGDAAQWGYVSASRQMPHPLIITQCIHSNMDGTSRPNATSNDEARCHGLN